MGVAVYVRDVDTREVIDSFPLLGASELETLWRPIIEKHGLNYFDYIIGAGLELNDENYGEVSRELDVIYAEIASQYSCDEVGSPAARCFRLVELVARFKPRGSTCVYIG